MHMSALHPTLRSTAVPVPGHSDATRSCHRLLQPLCISTHFFCHSRGVSCRCSPWIELFLECTVASCRHTVHLLRELGTIADQWRERLKARRTRKHAVIWRLVDLLLGQPEPMNRFRSLVATTAEVISVC